MVTVKGIKQEIRNGRTIITAIGYEEGDESKAFTFFLDAETFDLVESSREMDPYLYHAICAVQNKIQKTGNIPREAVSMWY